MANLNQAVQLIRQGRKDEARRILEPILKANPQDIQAWFWFAETCSTPEQRIKTLEICLKLNPANPQALRALHALQVKEGLSPPYTRSATQPFAAPSSVSVPKTEEIPDWARRPAPEAVPPPPVVPPVAPPAALSSAVLPSASSAALPSAAPAFIFDETEPERSSAPALQTSGGGWQQPGGESKPAFDWDALEKELAPAGTVFQEPLLRKEPSHQPRGKPLPFYRVWWQAVSTQSVAGYASIFDDPDAGTGRAFEWMAYTSALAGLLQPLLFLTNPQIAELRAMPEFQSMIGNANFFLALAVMSLVMAVLLTISNVIRLAFDGWLYNLLAILFGGKGTFGRTVYALASYQLPILLAISILLTVPYIGGILITPIILYSIILNIRALMAAHELPFGRALGVILLPGIILFILCCVLGILFGPVLVNALLKSG